MTFASPLLLLSLLTLPLLLKRGRRSRGMRISEIREAPASWRTRTRPVLHGLNLAALALLCIALARPQYQWQENEVEADALDILLALDISPSMLSKDFQPDRLTVAKRVLTEFIDNRPYDRIGLVAFAAEAFTQCPLTTDRQIVQRYLNELVVGRLEDGTAIGMGLATAVNRLKDSESRSKVVILVTDGENNLGYITPMQAAQIAGELGVKVYTVGIGSEGIVLSPSLRNPDGSYDFEPTEMRFDTRLLQDIADLTGGKFYRAYSAYALQEIYAEIDRLEKTRVRFTAVQHTAEFGPWLSALAAALLLLSALLRFTVLRSITDNP